jgi:hypothetical protein
MPEIAGGSGTIYTWNTSEPQFTPEQRSTMLAGGWFMFTWVRDPFARFVSTYSQMEAFYHMGWNHIEYKDNHIGYFRENCMAMPMDERIDVGDLQLPYNVTLEHRLARLRGFVDDVERVGFFDWHLTPQAAFFQRTDFGSILNFIGDTKNVTPSIEAIVSGLGLADEDAHRFAKPPKLVAQMFDGVGATSNVHAYITDSNSTDV